MNGATNPPGGGVHVDRHVVAVALVEVVERAAISATGS